jgi:RNA polymerase sigma-70 factor, ECF subfamily
VESEPSFDRLYRRHRRAVYGFVLRDVRDPDEAEDVTQVAFLNAFRAIQRGDEPERPRAWLLAIARNIVRRRARLRASRPREVELDPQIAFALDDVEGSTAEDICAALRGLPESQRRAILLREIQGRSYAEIGQVLDVSLPAVEALIFRARRALAAQLELLERAPAVQRRHKRGLLALPLPGFAKLGSFGLSFGRVGAACVLGCTVIAAVPLGGADSKGVAREALGPPARSAAVTLSATRPLPRPVVTPRKKETHAGPKPAAGGNEHAAAAQGSETQSGALSGVGLPAVDLPPATLPVLPPAPIQLPPPPVELPPPPALPPLPLVTS